MGCKNLALEIQSTSKEMLRVRNLSSFCRDKQQKSLCSGSSLKGMLKNYIQGVYYKNSDCGVEKA